mmetsp:Transcript_4554/g.13915  ORF Transcript_4554/g.13915 Transcript_4554/m.13915 type:complete len:206 (-) Transcript_4554:519-1136(-)
MYGVLLVQPVGSRHQLLGHSPPLLDGHLGRWACLHGLGKGQQRLQDQVVLTLAVDVVPQADDVALVLYALQHRQFPQIGLSVLHVVAFHHHIALLSMPVPSPASSKHACAASTKTQWISDLAENLQCGERCGERFNSLPVLVGLVRAGIRWHCLLKRTAVRGTNGRNHLELLVGQHRSQLRLDFLKTRAPVCIGEEPLLNKVGKF